MWRILFFLLLCLAFMAPVNADIFVNPPIYNQPQPVKNVATGSGAPNFVYNNSNSAATFSGANSATFALSTTVTATAGDGIRVTVWYGPTSIPIVSVTAGAVTCTQAATANQSTTISLYLYECPNVAAGTVTITGTINTSSTSAVEMVIVADDFTGDASTSPIDGTATAAFVADGTAGTALQPGSITTTANGDDIYCVVLSNQATPTAASGFTIRSNGVQGPSIWTDDAIQSTAGAINPGCFNSGTNAFDNIVAAMAIK